MQQYILYIIGFIFLIINILIVINDFKYKKIPNKLLLYLLGLLPFFYIFYNGEINILNNIIFGLISIFVSFGLYNYGVWSAGDAKYLFVLSLFLTNNSIVTFIGNIGIITLIYLTLYFIYFYFGKCVIQPKYGISLYKNIFGELKDKLYIYIGKNHQNYSKKIGLIKIFNYIFFFLVIFSSLKIFRYYFLKYFINSDFYKNYSIFFKENIIIILIILGIIAILLYFSIKNILIKIFKYLNINMDSNISIKIIIFFILIGFLIYEYNLDKIELFNYLKKLFTYYISIYIGFKILKYSYKLAFLIKDQNFINIENLQIGEIVDKDYLINFFGNQKSLGADGNAGILEPDPKKYFQKIHNPIDKETQKKLFQIYEIVNNYHLKENNTPGFEKIETVKILNTFSFGIYIFAGFILTYILGNFIIQILNEIFFSFLK